MKERKVYMAKRDTSWTMAKYKRFLSENRGTGELASYKPWLSIQDFPSKGRVSRIKAGRQTEYIISFQIYKLDVSTCLNGMMK